MCVHDAEHDFKHSVFKVIVYVKYEFRLFLVLKFLTGRWSVGWWSVGRWSVVGGFKKTHENQNDWFLKFQLIVHDYNS